jgi:haloacetate dehalogenase
MPWFDGFESRSFEVNGASINARVSKTTLGEPQRPRCCCCTASRNRM